MFPEVDSGGGYTPTNLATAIEAPPQFTREETPLSFEEICRLLDACEGSQVLDKRDKAIVMMFIDAGLRLGELTSLTHDQLMASGTGVWALVFDSKSDKHKLSIVGEGTREALAEYLAMRDDDNPALWMGSRGPLTKYGVYAAVCRKAKAAGLDRVHPHLLRKTFATQWVGNGGDETRLKKLAGWRFLEMLDIYVLLGKREDLQKLIVGLGRWTMSFGRDGKESPDKRA